MASWLIDQTNSTEELKFNSLSVAEQFIKPGIVKYTKYWTCRLSRENSVFQLFLFFVL